MIKFIIALLFLLIVAIIAGMVRKLRGGSFLPHDGLVMHMKTGQWRRRNGEAPSADAQGGKPQEK